MTQQAELLNRIDEIPQKYFGEVINFLGYLQHKAQQEASDSSPGQEASKRVIQLSKDSNGKLILTKEMIDEMLQNSPYTRSLSGILSGVGVVDLDKVRAERLAKHL
ncbi:MAG: hypothetical protein LBH44_05995 [Treponema sp.]|jgi:hypothetical protein|nr:hypothetical protein [Treponema sp.]